MIKSMTGYGHAKLEDSERIVSVEVKTLNSKFVDATIRLPKNFNGKEPEIKNLITEKLERGKISLVIEYGRLDDGSIPVEFNEALFKSYYKELNRLADMVNAPKEDIFRMALSYPDVQIQKVDDEKIEEEWKIINEVLRKALDQCDSFRINEGHELEAKFMSYLDSIDNLLEEVEKNDPQRLTELKVRLKKSLDDMKLNGDVDQNRFEQELIYYIEKLDISEEKVRLKSHIKHFNEVMKAETSQGKKLNFISQEMGREINTIGSKASYAPIQKLVVGMKDELEKIKEQIQNIV